MKYLYILIFIYIGSGIANSVFAATYNFTFNNTEQGDNSTATPTVTIQDPKTGEVKVISPDIVSDKNTKSFGKADSTGAIQGGADFHHFKLGLEYLPDYNRDSHSIVGLFAFTPFQSINLSASFLLGQSFGAELEYLPWTSRFQLGVVAGVLNYSGGSDSFAEATGISQSKTFGGNVQPHLGVSGIFNILPELSASLLVRRAVNAKWTNESVSLAYNF